MYMRCLCLFLLCVPLLAVQPPLPDCSVVAGVDQKGEVRSFGPDNLFEYMDGNAEGYILYEFQRMTGITCASGDSTILIDISQMATSELAYGMFSANKHAAHEVRKIGTAGQVMPRNATFVKGSYYVELAANPAKDHTAALEALPRTSRLASRLHRTAGRAELVSERPARTRLRAAGSAERARHADAQARLRRYICVRARVCRPGGFRRFGVRCLIEVEGAGLRSGSAANVGDEAFTGADRYLGKVCFARKGAYVLGFVNIKEGDGKAPAAALAS